MNSANWLLPPLTVALFAAASAYGYRGQKGLIAVLLSIGIVACLALQGGIVGHSGWQVSLHQSLLASLALAEFCYLLTSLTARSMWRLSMLVQPVLGIVYALALLSPVRPEAVLALTPLLATHIALALLGYGLLTMAAFAAFAVYTREAYLKAHSASGFSTRLPFLDAADRGQFVALLMGAVVMAGALIAGAMFQHEQTGVWFVPTVKTVFTYATFAAILSLLAARRLWGTRGARAARLIMLTYVLLVVAFLGGKLALLLPQ